MALAAIALLAGLTAAFAAADVSALAGRQRSELTAAVAVAAAAAWDRNNSWTGADLSPVLDLASRTGADVKVLDRAGRVVAISSGFAAHASDPQFSAPAEVRGVPVGRAVVRFTGAGLGQADHSLQLALLRAIAGTAGLAALAALLTGLAVARRITRPVDPDHRGDPVDGARRPRRPGRADQSAPASCANWPPRSIRWPMRWTGRSSCAANLVADVAHELRTPIAILQAGHEALLDGVAEPTPAQLGSLRDEVLRLAQMVDDLQTLAAADAAALRLAQQRCDLAAIAATAADSLAGRFEAAGITVHRQLAGAGSWPTRAGCTRR